MPYDGMTFYHSRFWTHV